jgi:hypothetical protein
VVALDFDDSLDFDGDASPDEELSFDELDAELEVESDVESVEAGGVVLEVLPRLSFLKKPVPLNVTPTGWNTFLTAMRSPESGWTYSVSESSVNDCCTSMVSPVSTNL